MTFKDFERANEIIEQIKTISNGVYRLEAKVSLRKRHIEEHNAGKRRWLPLPEMFCQLIWENYDQKPVVDAPVEGFESIDFALDEECIDFIIRHEKEKIAKLKKELEEI